MDNQEELLFELKVDILKALSNITRLRIAEMLLGKELCVNDIVEVIGQERTSVSKHLRILQKANILSSRRDGTTVYYSLQVPCIVNIFGCIEEVLRHQVKSRVTILQNLENG